MSKLTKAIEDILSKSPTLSCGPSTIMILSHEIDSYINAHYNLVEKESPWYGLDDRGLETKIHELKREIAITYSILKRRKQCVTTTHVAGCDTLSKKPSTRKDLQMTIW